MDIHKNQLDLFSEFFPDFVDVGKVKIDIVLDDGVEMPKYATPGSSGFDVQANITDDVILLPGSTKLIPTGIRISVPFGYEAQCRSRSGLAYKNGVFVLNSPGTIDSDYRGEIKVILHNASDEQFTVTPKMRIAQLVICPVIHDNIIKFVQKEDLITTSRGVGGFGSTGV